VDKVLRFARYCCGWCCRGPCARSPAPNGSRRSCRVSLVGGLALRRRANAYDVGAAVWLRL